MNNIISIIVPCRNEENYIFSCLTSILNFQLPLNTEIEIIVMDGLSTDNTKEIVNNFLTNSSNVKLYDNTGIYQSSALNLGLSYSKGNYILRLDAHAEYPNDYLLNCYNTLIETNADNVGGIVITKPGSNNFESTIVQSLTTHKFGVGNSAFRTELNVIGPSDTVPFGFFKKEIFERIGFFDERLKRCQDYEFNRRIVANGGKIIMNSLIYSYYYNQSSLYTFYKKQFFNEAPYNTYMCYLAPYSFSVRHFITGLFSSGIIFGLLLSSLFAILKYIYLAVIFIYIFIAFVSSLQQSIRYRKSILLIILPPCFFIFHFIHGLGIIHGLLRLMTDSAPVMKANKPWAKSNIFYKSNLNKLKLPKYEY